MPVLPMPAPETDATADPAARLIAAAGPVFAQRGFDRAPVRQIAQAAGVNVAAINYYYGDKMGLYRAVVASIRDKRQHEFPTPVVGKTSPEKTLGMIVRTLLSRMLAADEKGWEAMLLMREMQQPTTVLSEMIREYFQPIYDLLYQTIEQLIPPIATPDAPQSWRDEALVAQLTLGVVGQCLYYRIGCPVYEQLIAADVRSRHYDTESLCRHITASTLAACGRTDIVTARSRLETETPAPKITALDRRTDIFTPPEE